MAADVIRCPGCGVNMDLSTFPVRPEQVVCPRCHTRSLVPSAYYPYQDAQAPTQQYVAQQPSQLSYYPTTSQVAVPANPYAAYPYQSSLPQQLYEQVQPQAALPYYDYTQPRPSNYEVPQPPVSYAVNPYEPPVIYPPQVSYQQEFRDAPYDATGRGFVDPQQMPLPFEQTLQSNPYVQQFVSPVFPQGSYVQPMQQVLQRVAYESYPSASTDAYHVTMPRPQEGERVDSNTVTVQQVPAPISYSPSVVEQSSMQGAPTVVEPIIPLPIDADAPTYSESILTRAEEPIASEDFARDEDATAISFDRIVEEVESIEDVYQDDDQPDLSSYEEELEHDVYSSEPIEHEESSFVEDVDLYQSVKEDETPTTVLMEPIEAIETVEVIEDQEDSVPREAQDDEVYLLPIDKKGNTEPFAFALIGFFSTVFLIPFIGIFLCITSLTMNAQAKRNNLYCAYRGATFFFAIAGLVLNAAVFLIEMILLSSILMAPDVFRTLFF